MKSELDRREACSRGVRMHGPGSLLLSSFIRRAAQNCRDRSEALRWGRAPSQSGKTLRFVLNFSEAGRFHMSLAQRKGIDRLKIF